GYDKCTYHSYKKSGRWYLNQTVEKMIRISVEDLLLKNLAFKFPHSLLENPLIDGLKLTVGHGNLFSPGGQASSKRFSLTPFLLPV
ncbi:hypothetical protein CEXT_399471, partial [Caerostris extrusa]